MKARQEWFPLDQTKVRLVTRFNEDEVVSIELIELEYCGVVEDFYSALGHGVLIEELPV